MAEKRTRRSRSEVLQEKLDKAKADREKYTQKIAELDKTISTLEEELTSSRSEEIMAEIAAQGLSIDEALAKLWA